MFMIKKIIILSLSFVLSASLVSSAIILQSTLWNLFWLKTRGFDISWETFLLTFSHDIQGALSPILVQWGVPINFYSVISASLLIAFLVTFLTRLMIPINSRFSYSFAGFLSIYVMITLTIIQYDGIILISGARENTGLFVLCCVGALGGFLFDFLLNRFPGRVK